MKQPKINFNEFIRAGGSNPRSVGLNDLILCIDTHEAELLLRKAHINALAWYLCGKYTNYPNYLQFNLAACRLLKDKRIVGRRRNLLERFIGKIASLRFQGKLKMEDVVECRASTKRR